MGRMSKSVSKKYSVRIRRSVFKNYSVSIGKSVLTIFILFGEGCGNLKSVNRTTSPIIPMVVS